MQYYIIVIYFFLCFLIEKLRFILAFGRAHLDLFLLDKTGWLTIGRLENIKTGELVLENRNWGWNLGTEACWVAFGHCGHLQESTVGTWTGALTIWSKVFSILVVCTGQRWTQEGGGELEKFHYKEFSYSPKFNLSHVSYILISRFRNRTLAVQIFLLVMPKYGGKQIFSHRSFPEVGEKQKA